MQLNVPKDVRNYLDDHKEMKKKKEEKGKGKRKDKRKEKRTEKRRDHLDLCPHRTHSLPGYRRQP